MCGIEEFPPKFRPSFSYLYGTSPCRKKTCFNRYILLDDGDLLLNMSFVRFSLAIYQFSLQCSNSATSCGTSCHICRVSSNDQNQLTGNMIRKKNVNQKSNQLFQLTGLQLTKFFGLAKIQTLTKPKSPINRFISLVNRLFDLAIG